jgi:isopenicillin N synthase-like dioxygenase
MTHPGDYGCLTILNTDETTGALQVMSKSGIETLTSGEWINADPLEGAFVINIGDMINVWTNGLYKSTLHRVIHTKQSYRISVPFFYEPSFDSVITPLPNCVKMTGGEEVYKQVVYGDHLLSKVSNNFDEKEGAN